jgi:hypothetical protein
METPIKKELHQLIENCDNEVLLAEAKELLESDGLKDWWNELNEKDKSLVLESETEYEKGNFINHKDLMQQFEEWKKK